MYIQNTLDSTKLGFQVASISIAAILLLSFSSFSVLALVGTLFFIYILNSLILNIGEGVPVNLVIVFLASLQWILGPVLSYYTGINHPFYGMQVPEDEYFSYVVPGVVFYHVGFLLPLVGVSHLPKLVVKDLHHSISRKQKGAYYLIGIGFFASLVGNFAPASLSFFLYLLSQLKFIGCFYLYMHESRNNTVLLVVFSTLLLEALATALFHDLLLWGMFFIFIYCIKNKVSLLRKLTFLVVGFFLVFLLQSVKYQYRNIAWFETSLSTSDRAKIFFDMILERLWSPEVLFAASENETTITRLNQGWIITRVMNYIPAYEPFAEGETVKDAFSAALLPRVIAGDKAGAGGQQKMERFTGIILQRGTSMNISLIGEGYGNYGRLGGMIFMFCIGIVFSLILRFIILKSLKNPTYLFWIPFLYLQVVKAETDLTTTLNYLVKASIVMYLVFYSFRRIFRIEI